MFDDYSLRLLTEIGIDVYLPRSIADAPVNPPAAEMDPIPVQSDVRHQKGNAEQSANVVVDTLILCEQRRPERLLNDLLRALRGAGVSGDFGAVSDLVSISAVRGLVVLGEPLARTLGPGLSAQQQNAITWVVAAEPSALVDNASAKRALWGEIKRLSRALTAASRSV